jgi:hypothetical protein
MVGKVREPDLIAFLVSVYVVVMADTVVIPG